MALHLIIDNSTCIINGLSLDQYKSLRELLSYSINPQASYFSGSFNNKRYLLTKRNEFPSGLLPRVMQWLVDGSLKYSSNDRRTRPEAIVGLHNLSLPITPYPDQLEAVKWALRANRSIIQMPTGSGKSITAALLIQALQVRTLVVVPNLELKRQLSADFTKYFGNLDNIVIENIDSTSLTKHTDFDCLIIDEAHHSAAKTYRKLNARQWKGIYHRYCFTATPFRSQEEERLLMESITGILAYKLPYLDAVERGYIVPVQAYYIEVPKTNVEGYSWAEVYNELVINNTARNEIIAAILLTFHANKVPTLCLVKEIAHGGKLSDLTGAAFAHGQGEDRDILIPGFNSGKLNTIIGTNGVLGEGVDTKPAEIVIIAGLGKSKPAFMQQVGRGVRRYGSKESCKVILFKDMSHKWTKAHYKEQCKILLDEYGVIPVELKV